MVQAEVNIGVVGHVDHGKTTLTKALTGKWADEHSEEQKRGITIKLGYADVEFKECASCGKLFSGEQCVCSSTQGETVRRVSFLDAPGHETLMATVIAASSIMDGALFVVAANEECPQPQTQEHLMVLEASGIQKIVIAQNKADLVDKAQALKHYKQLKAFLKGTRFEDAPVIPTAANSGANLPALMRAIQEFIPTPERDKKAAPRLMVARSFDINKPGKKLSSITGGVVGGSITTGEFKVGDEVRIAPGARREQKGRDSYVPLTTKITALHAGGSSLKEAGSGGLVALATELDPALTKSDSLTGCVVTKAGEELPVKDELKIKINPLPRVLESFADTFVESEPLVLGVGTATTVGFVVKQKKGKVKLKLKKPVALVGGTVIAVMRRAGNRWRLYATAELID
jgi:translation initiation factor 2 subunit 3